ncbi:MAG: hypothetical protein NTZ33_09795 [Bacteroidetes bacterium]|nr:hypothetical protein [Bacteroidota bacterium]
MKNLIFFLFLLILTLNLSSQTIIEKEIQKYIKTIDSLKSKHKLLKISYPDMSDCGGGLDGYYFNNKLVLIDATYQAELGYSRRTIYLKDTLFIKIIFRKHFAEWEKYFKKYPTEKREINPLKMTYTDTIHEITFCTPTIYCIKAKKKIISKKIDKDLIGILITCGQKMKKELEKTKTNR